MKRIGIVLLLSLVISQAFTQEAQNIAGIWWNDKKTSKIEIKEENGKFSGTVIYINPEKYVNGEPEKDFNNPDPKLKTRSRLGLQILSGLKFHVSDNEWQGGRIYDPDNGKTYNCYAWFGQDPNVLYLKGYVVGIKWLGRSTTWTRVAN
ncbi:MAG TPA: DUF2147 domain-containing protein [Prolixibacteraceae bacterium]|nr:DUF2147 domain-containing protein [Prolixibacteraceae bacterium]